MQPTEVKSARDSAVIKLREEKSNQRSSVRMSFAKPSTTGWESYVPPVADISSSLVANEQIHQEAKTPVPKIKMKVGSVPMNSTKRVERRAATKPVQ